MTVTAVYPSGANTFVPSLEASGAMQIEFSRNINDFALNKYIKLVPTSKMVGLYLDIGREQAARLLGSNYDTLWSDGADRPDMKDGQETHAFREFRCARRALGFRLGDLAVDQAAWDIVASHARIQAQRAMTIRTYNAVTLFQTSGNWPTGHTSAVSSISGVTGKWDVSTTARADIKRSINYAIEKINLSSLGVVKQEDLQLVVSYKCARQMAESQEIIDYMKGSYVARQEIEGKGNNVAFTLPKELYGIPIVVEKTVKVTSKKNATLASSEVMLNTAPFICSRPGGLIGAEGVPSFSTGTMFVYAKDDMTVEEFHDQNNRVTRGSVVDNHATVLTAGVTGFLFTAAVA